MDGWWDAERLDETFYRLLRSDARRVVRTPTVLFSSLAATLVNKVTRAWPDLRARYDERLRRMWTYYLLQCAGLFRARGAQLWQIVLSKEGVAGGWASIR